LLCVDKVERATHFFLAIFNYYNAINTVLRFVLTVHYYFTVLPSFSGNVPAVFSKLFPSANITRLGDWNTVDVDPRWCCTYLLGPSDALFIEVGQAFIKQQIKGMYLSFFSLQHMKLDFVPKLVYRYSSFSFIFLDVCRIRRCN